MNWKEALQQASNDSSIAYRIEESCDHMAAIWPKDGIVFVGEENPGTVCHVCTKVQSEEQVERLNLALVINLVIYNYCIIYPCVPKLNLRQSSVH